MSEAVTPAIAREIAAILEAAGFTVRKLREHGFGATAASSLLGRGGGLPSIESADRALALLKPPRELWHRRRKGTP